MRRSFPLMMKYPPISSASSWWRTSSEGGSPLRLHRVDCSRNSRSVMGASKNQEDGGGEGLLESTHFDHDGEHS